MSPVRNFVQLCRSCVFYVFFLLFACLLCFLWLWLRHCRHPQDNSRFASPTCFFCLMNLINFVIENHWYVSLLYQAKFSRLIGCHEFSELLRLTCPLQNLLVLLVQITYLFLCPSAYLTYLYHCLYIYIHPLFICRFRKHHIG